MCIRDRPWSNNTYGGDANHFYSFNIGSAHIIGFSTEFYYYTEFGFDQIANQYAWLEADLRVSDPMKMNEDREQNDRDDFSKPIHQRIERVTPGSSLWDTNRCIAATVMMIRAFKTVAIYQ